MRIIRVAGIKMPKREMLRARRAWGVAMGSVADEFRRFMESLAVSNASDDVRRVTKIVQASLAELIPTGTAGGRRATVLTPILRAQFDTTDPAIPMGNAQLPHSAIPWNRLVELTLGPFRGFRLEEKFELNKRVVLFYGPNGSGKTSLCEAFELSMLGRIEEAEARRFSDLDGYITNIHAAAFKKPVLTCSLAGAAPSELIPDANLYRFCIIEKNRIDDFARIAARSTGSANSLIGALFGLEDFDEFVNGFTGNLRSQLHVDRPVQAQLIERRQAIEADNKVLEEYAASSSAQAEAESALARSYDLTFDFAKLRAMVGADGQSGRLQELEKALETPLQAHTGISVNDLRTGRLKMRELLRRRAGISSDLQARANEVSYEALYTAIARVRELSPQACPACSTLIVNAAEDPYAKAERGLAALRDLADLDNAKQSVEGELRSGWSSLRSTIEQIVRYADLPIDQKARAHQLLDNVSTQSPLVDPLANYQKPAAIKLWRRILRTARRAMHQDRSIDLRHTERRHLAVERQRLFDFRIRVESLRERRRTLEMGRFAAQRRIEEFNAQNADLVARAEAEEATSLREQRIGVAYEEFVRLLDEYRSKLPHTLVADLNEVTKAIYNSFNAGDHPGDLLSSLTMPLEGGQEILIAFAAAPERQRNALQVLSEGHIRCLGLAILLAQNLKLGLPVIIFDDPVNAIDHDHRGGIRDTLLDDPRFAGKQIIISSHSNEFVKDIQNHVGSDRSALYVLRHHDGDHVPKITRGSCRHYLERAQRHLDELDLRGTLAYSRQALEHLTQLLWKKLEREDLGELTLDHRGPNAHPDLKHLADKLRDKVQSEINKGHLTEPRWQIVLDALNYILNIDSTNLVWIYLNKGVHDELDREDFEASIVSRVLEELRKMDEALRRPRGGGAQAQAPAAAPQAA
jgi:recombinational DNA repair ATPase RecF